MGEPTGRGAPGPTCFTVQLPSGCAHFTHPGSAGPPPDARPHHGTQLTPDQIECGLWCSWWPKAMPFDTWVESHVRKASEGSPVNHPAPSGQVTPQTLRGRRSGFRNRRRGDAMNHRQFVESAVVIKRSAGSDRAEESLALGWRVPVAPGSPRAVQSGGRGESGPRPAEPAGKQVQARMVEPVRAADDGQPVGAEPYLGLAPLDQACLPRARPLHAGAASDRIWRRWAAPPVRTSDSRQPQIGLLVALPGEHVLEERSVGRIHEFDDMLERHILVLEGIQGHLPYPAHELGHRRPAGRVDAQRESVDEDADQTFEFGPAPVGDRGANSQTARARPYCRPLRRLGRSPRHTGPVHRRGSATRSWASACPAVDTAGDRPGIRCVDAEGSRGHSSLQPRRQPQNVVVVILHDAGVDGSDQNVLDRHQHIHGTLPLFGSLAAPDAVPAFHASNAGGLVNLSSQVACVPGTSWEGTPWICAVPR